MSEPGPEPDADVQAGHGCPLCGGYSPCACRDVLQLFVADMHSALQNGAWRGGRSGVEWADGTPEFLERELAYRTVRASHAITCWQRGEDGVTSEGARRALADVAIAALVIADQMYLADGLVEEPGLDDDE